MEQLRVEKQFKEMEPDFVITKKDHPCSNRHCKIKIIPKGSKAWPLKREEDQFEITESGTKPLGSKWVTYYKHYPDCDSPELPPEDKQHDLF